MRDYENEKKQRVEFIRASIESASASGVVFGNSGGKDSALVGILCKMACDNTVGIIMPCGSQRNYEMDREDAEKIANHYGITTRLLDLSDTRDSLLRCIEVEAQLNNSAIANIAPRLRMTTLYAVAASENLLVAGTGNASERYMGYFTKWGDGAFDFNPIADLRVTEVYEFLNYLNAPSFIFGKAPSAGLFDGQTDEDDMGITYERIDDFLLNGTASEDDRAIIERYHTSSEHKRIMPRMFPGLPEQESR